MRPIAPRTGAPEVTIAEEQEEYMPMTVAKYVDPSNGVVHVLSRWTFTPEEREAIAKGEDIYIAQLNFGSPITPMVVGCGLPEQYKME